MWLKVMTALILLTILPSGQGSVGTAFLCFTKHQLGQLEGWGLESSEGLFTHVSAG
jgi:hypothetical protein